MNIKLCFSLLAISLAFDAQATGEITQRPLFKISYDKNTTMADKTEEILREKYGIPEGFIYRERKEDPCLNPSSNRDSLLHVCLMNSGEHRILKAETKILKRSFQVLRN